MKKFMVALCVLFASGPALAQTQMSGSGAMLAGSASDEPEGPSTNEPTADGERRICRRIETSESRVGRRRLCLTAAEWRDRARQSN